MKKVSGALAFLFVLASMAPSAAMAEDDYTEDTAPVVESNAPADELAPVKDAWLWASTVNPELAARLEKIVNGDRADASTTLNEAATATAEANPDLSAKLSTLATAWTPAVN